MSSTSMPRDRRKSGLGPCFDACNLWDQARPLTRSITFECSLPAPICKFIFHPLGTRMSGDNVLLSTSSVLQASACHDFPTLFLQDVPYWYCMSSSPHSLFDFRIFLSRGSPFMWRILNSQTQLPVDASFCRAVKAFLVL